jgi:Rps23 Pro-64 3,4-dihydroxylase Tpa1-like proline 4-hydroxylase
MINKINFKKLHKEYINNTPYSHIVIDDFLDKTLCEKLESSFPDHSEDFWLKYNNPVEKKLLYNNLDSVMPKEIKSTLLAINEDWFLEKLKDLTGINNLISDSSFHGGGMHCTKRMGKLDVHIDYSLHPQLRLERRINLILYLNSDWESKYGGNLELWNKDMTKRIKSIEPKFNRAVIFNTTDISFHGHPSPLMCPEKKCRKSLAWYYLTKPQQNVSERYRAKFVARPSDSKDDKLEKFRKDRSELSKTNKLFDEDNVE